MKTTLLNRVVAVLGVLMLLGGPCIGQDEPSDAEPAEAASDAPNGEFTAYPEEPSVTYHSVTINGTEIWYEAKAGTISMVDSDHETTAKMFYMAYRKLQMNPERYFAAIESKAAASDEEGAEDVAEPAEDIGSLYPDAADRPITFSFNGGPGSSSVWLHLGLFGPRRVDYADDFGHPGPPPWQVVENELSLLDQSDFVFIDPVTTGLSRPVGDGKGGDFHGLENDTKSVAEFIRRYLVMDRRWRSPKFIAGESYGTTRAAALSRELWSRHGIGLNGIVLVSAIMNFQTTRFAIGNDLPYPLYLPTYTAIAHFHEQLSDRLQAMTVAEAVDESIAFATGAYTLALMRGDALSDDDQQSIAARLAELTGLDAGFILRSNLRVGMPAFPKELLRDQGLTVGRLDGRFLGQDRDDAGSRYEYDSSMAAISGIYTGSLNAYLREELGYESDLPYEILTGRVHPWSYQPEGNNRYVNVAERLRSAIHQQPTMRVFLASGYYDLATPFYAADYTFDHLQLADNLRGNIETHYYEAGHMMYIHRPSFEKLKADLDAFYESATGG